MHTPGPMQTHTYTDSVSHANQFSLEMIHIKHTLGLIYIHTYIYIYIYIYTHTHTHTHTVPLKPVSSDET